jgi:hypothetical protein
LNDPDFELNKYYWENYSMKSMQVTFGSNRYPPVEPLEIEDGTPDNYVDAYRRLQHLIGGEGFGSSAGNDWTYEKYTGQFFVAVIEIG